MIKQLKINNFVLIEQQEVILGAGVNALIGETGSGKTILLNAINLISGRRASVDYIRDGQDYAIVEATICLNTKLKKRLKTLDVNLAADSDELIVYRQIDRKGTSKVRINGLLVTLTELQKLMDGVIDFHSQHQTIALLDGQEYLKIVDQFAQTQTELKSYQQYFIQYQTIEKKLIELEQMSIEKDERISILSFRINELEQISEISNFEELQTQHSNYKEIIEKQKDLNELTSSLDVINRNLASFASQSSKLISDDQFNLLNNALINLEELSFQLDQARTTELTDFDYEQMSEQISLVKQLMRKYKCDFDELQTNLQAFQVEIQNLNELEFQQHNLQKTKQELMSKLREYGQKISEKRKAAAQKLMKEINKQFSDLQMENAEFKIEISQTEYLSNGLDKVEFKIKTNVGSSFKSLNEVASGGELSRFILGIKTALSKKYATEVMIFDEIDTGVNGHVALKMGKKILEIAQNSQVILISHVPQVVACANQAFFVQKEVQQNQTNTTISRVENEQFIEQLGLMISGDKLTEDAARQAENLIAGYVN
ncbi:MAG: DNA repair protein RecN [Mycoplasmatales bacterium]